MHQQYPTWPNTQAFLEEIQQEMVPGRVNLTQHGGSGIIQARRGLSRGIYVVKPPFLIHLGPPKEVLGRSLEGGATK